jgi:formamidopyrimidine-DNA glycosylase
MPELPDIEAYVCALRSRTTGERLRAARVAKPFLLRTVNPPLEDCIGRRVEAVRRLGKRIVIESSCAETDDANAAPLLVVLHLMIAGRLQWKKPGSAIPRSSGLAALDFDTGTLLLTEAGSKRRASLHVLQGAGALDELDAGGMEISGSTLEQFEVLLTRENHTLKRALTDPRLFSGIGNAYSDEILHRARLSRLRRQDSANRLRRKRVRLLSRLPDRRASFGRQSPFQVAQKRLAYAGINVRMRSSVIKEVVPIDSMPNKRSGHWTGGGIRL